MKRSKRSNAPWLIVLFLAMGIGIFMIFNSESKKTDDGRAYATATPIPTATPQPGGDSSSAAPAVTAAPETAPTVVPTVAPTSTPEPTPVPTATPAPTAEPTPAVAEKTGSFRSDSGTYLNVILKWHLIPEGETVKLQLDAYVESYALYNGARDGAVCFTVNGEKTWARSPDIAIDNNVLTETLLASATVDVTDKQSVPVSVSWAFNGEYSKKQVDTITAEGTISLY